MSNANMSFEQLLSAWLKAHAGAVSMLKELCERAVGQMEDNFQLSNLQKLNDALAANKNTTRHSVFCDWLVEFFPLKMEKGKLKKSSERAMQLDWEAKKATICQAALAKPFWDWKPDKKVTTFDSAEAFKAEVEKTIRRLGKKATFDGSTEVMDALIYNLNRTVPTEPAAVAA